MTPVDIIQAEKTRAAKVWHDLCAAPIGEGPYEPIIQRALLEARAAQIWDVMEEVGHNEKEHIEGIECVCCKWGRLATALETAEKGLSK